MEPKMKLLFSIMLGLAATFLHAAGEAKGGFFVPYNGGWEGRIGLARFAVPSVDGGLLELRDGSGTRLARLGWECSVLDPHGQPLQVRQELDRAPVVRFLEEGDQRLGVRVLFRLYDGNGLYHGHGMTEVWAYPDGQLFVTAAAMFEDPSAHAGVSEAALKLDVPGGIKTLKAGGDVSRSGEAVTMPVFVTGSNAPPAGWIECGGVSGKPLWTLYWRPSWKMDHHNFVARSEGGSPTYYRWPAYLGQAYYGFGPPRTARVDLDGRMSLDWDAGKTTNKPGACFGAVFRLTANAESAPAFAAADRQPLDLTIEGGVPHVTARFGGTGYNDQEGAYEIRKTGDVLRVVLPADVAGRTVRVKVVGLSGHGAVAAELDGRPVVPQLAGDGGIADDPLAPIKEQPEGPADMALVAVRLGPAPRVLTVRETEGVQLAYQNRDAWRSYCLYGTKTGARWPGYRFSLVDGRARAMRKYGEREYALGENLLTWFSFCGYTPLQIADSLEDFTIVRNGPDEVVFRYASLNANGRARSVYEVATPAAATALTMRVKAEFQVLESWPFSNVQFFDVFPFRGVLPQDWWYGEVLFVAPDGRVKWLGTLDRKFGGDTTVDTFSGGGFFALYSADRGNMLMLTKNFKPDLPVRHVICGNYVDFHMEVLFKDAAGKPAPPARGTTVSMEYELAVWGDATATREQLIEIGKRSIQAGRLVLE
jgi:hypothetical protein